VGRACWLRAQGVACCRRPTSRSKREARGNQPRFKSKRPRASRMSGTDVGQTGPEQHMTSSRARCRARSHRLPKYGTTLSAARDERLHLSVMICIVIAAPSARDWVAVWLPLLILQATRVLLASMDASRRTSASRMVERRIRKPTSDFSARTRSAWTSVRWTPSDHLHGATSRLP
jgi:hypothetical protein